MPRKRQPRPAPPSHEYHLGAYWHRLEIAPDTPLEDVPIAELQARLDARLDAYFGAIRANMCEQRATVAEQAAALADIQNTLPAAIALLDAGDLKGARAALTRLLDMVVQ